MKVLDLACAHGHVFEGWFGSEADYLDQRSRGLLECPLCGNAEVSKRLSAPRLNLGPQAPVAQAPVASPHLAASSPAKDPGTVLSAVAAADPEFAKAWMEMAKRVLAHTTDVGDKFADEARRQHYGEAEERGIRGRATPEQTQELLEEGIAVMPLPLPEALKGPLQ
ncbi:MAG: hypothetical protein RLZZ126_326 [Pseudomonadota bacterium]|jgi:hypothetical protein